MTIQEARQFLKEQGYFTDNLWHISDVTTNYECTDDEAYEVLSVALNNDATREQTWRSIDQAADFGGHINKPFKTKEI